MNPQRTKSFPELRRARFHPPDEAPAADGATTLVPGTQLGRYVLLYRIGGGGMGDVYAAYDPELDRKVALKLLTRPLEPEQAEALTRREAQAMARLAHPNVVTVHDVCTYGDRVFIAMEHLDGQTLKDWLAAAERPWPRVLEVFIQAGRGLAAAHAADLVHLDFKPGNVMLTGDGGVRVLDFGLAELDLSSPGGALPGLADGRETLTQADRQDGCRWIVTGREAIRGTPAYVAPERLRGGSADARSDQFSFSVALYEALYGERPFGGESLEVYFDQVRRGAVREPPPAKRVPGWLRKALLRGLRPEPEDRFSSMGELLEALSPEPRRARNRWSGAAAGLLALGAVVIGYRGSRPEPVPICAGASERLSGAWDEERKVAVREAFFGTRIPFAGQAFENLEQVLDRYTRDWIEVHTEACEATHVRGEQSENLLDLRMLCLDRRLEEVRALTTVLTDVDARAMAKSVEAAGKLSDLDACSDRVELMNWRLPPVETEARQAVADMRAVVEEHAARERTTGAVELSALEESVEDARRVGYAPVEAKALYLLAQEQLYVVGDAAAAEETFKRALLAAISAGDRVLQARVYGALIRTVGYFQSRPEDARWWQRLAEATLSALGPGHDDVEIRVYQALGLMAREPGDSETNGRYMMRALEIAERAWAPDDPRLGSVLNNAALHHGLDQVEERIRYLERALSIVEKAYGRWNPVFMGPSLTNLGTAYYDAGRYEEALATSRRCLAVLEEFYGEHRDLTYPLVNVGFILNYSFDRPAEAESHLRRALPLAEKGFGNQHPLMGHLLNALGDALARQQRYDEAEQALGQAYALRQTFVPGHQDHIDSLNSLGRLALARRRTPEALRNLERALSLIDEKTLRDYRVYMSTLTSLGAAYLESGRRDRARAHLERALGMEWAERFPRLSSEARFALARALDADERDRAVELATQAQRGLSGSSPMTESLRRRIESWLRATSPRR